MKKSPQDTFSRQDIYWFGVNFPPGRLFKTGRVLETIEYQATFLVTFCDKTAENWASFQTHERTDGWTDGHGSQNSYLDEARPKHIMGKYLKFLGLWWLMY